MGFLYSKFKVFHYKDKIDSLPPEGGGIEPPVHVRIRPTNACAHHCWYCAYRSAGLQLGRDMVPRDRIPREKMLEIVDDLVEMGVRAVTFSGGGDPFYYPHLLETVKKLARSPVRFASLHNGSRLEGEIAEVFAHRATWLRVSMDGWDDESYSGYRGVPRGEFSKVIRNLEAFKRLEGSCFLGISLIIDQRNAGHVYEITKRVKEIGVDSIKMSACIVDDDAARSNAYHRGIFEKVKEQIARARQELASEGFEISDAYHELDGRFQKDYDWCPYLQILPVIGADLNVYTCQDKAYNLEDGVLGSIREVRFKDFWLSDRNKFFRVDPSRDCLHHCVASHKNRMILEYLDADPGHRPFV